MPRTMSVTFNQEKFPRGWVSILTVDITETTSFALLCMMKPTGPIDGDIALLAVEPRSSFHASASADATELEEPVEDWTVVTNVEATLFFLVCVHVVRGDFLQEVDVFIGVELSHLMVGSRFSSLVVCQ